MLVISRQCSNNPNDKYSTVLIGDDIVVRVLEVRGDRVRLGFIAPQEISILRAELDNPARDNEFDRWESEQE